MAETVKHTLGPWSAQKASHGPIFISDENGRDVATVWGGHLEIEDREAIANMVVAAPNMLKTLKYIAKTWPDSFAARSAKTAVREAEGRS